MKNPTEGFSPEPVAQESATIAPQEEATLRSEFEIMQRLDFVFIRELGISSADEYIVEITSLTGSMRDGSGRKAA